MQNGIIQIFITHLSTDFVFRSTSVEIQIALKIVILDLTSDLLRLIYSVEHFDSLCYSILEQKVVDQYDQVVIGNRVHFTQVSDKFVVLIF